jgi:hypothetical protein
VLFRIISPISTGPDCPLELFDCGRLTTTGRLHSVAGLSRPSRYDRCRGPFFATILPGTDTLLLVHPASPRNSRRFCSTASQGTVSIFGEGHHAYRTARPHTTGERLALGEIGRRWCLSRRTSRCWDFRFPWWWAPDVRSFGGRTLRGSLEQLTGSHAQDRRNLRQRGSACVWIRSFWRSDLTGAALASSTHASPAPSPLGTRLPAKTKAALWPVGLVPAHANRR